MRKELSGTPTLEPDAFLWRIRDWKSLLAGPGNNRIVVEWCVTNGPKCFVYPAAQRSAGFDLCAEAPHDTSDERWADWLEYHFVPGVAETLQSGGFPAQIICSDQRPVQVMRERRRQMESYAHQRAGHHH